jgi:hypothetical protein
MHQLETKGRGIETNLNGVGVDNTVWDGNSGGSIHRLYVI